MDNHTVSTTILPLPSDSSYPSPSWLVTILRTGTPVDRFYINDDNLPPRTNKKKVLWKLPSDEHVQVRLNAKDELRVLNLYKLRKKERKKKARNNAPLEDLIYSVPLEIIKSLDGGNGDEKKEGGITEEIG
eukprot:CAMPEP_0118646290 /NCGR_PEP_ID=MMETSP0785-20121206/7974_1 /TAXON_ID=91992 /ORGANISM="Bolidomonas pacifica, Strain CCMP 1866" /LENGTH=130 /DNA_ID=CAMNT_0006538267 /DNA_START=141 /DNA_END=530 /DNA_ORIENTATION=+